MVENTQRYNRPFFINLFTGVYPGVLPGYTAVAIAILPSALFIIRIS